MPRDVREPRVGAEHRKDAVGEPDHPSVTTAAMLSKRLARSHDIRLCDIGASHLEDFYPGLRNVYSAVDPARISEILSAVVASGDVVAPVWGVMVETRRHRALERVVLGVLDGLGIPVQLFHGRDNREFILDSAIGDAVARGNVVLTPLATGNLEVREYNRLLLDRRFWDTVIGRRGILVFQTDSMYCPATPFDLHDFAHFAYIGSCWRPQRPSGLVIEGGSGGFSLRDWSMMQRVLERFPPQGWHAGEDGYFAFHVELIGGRVASFEESSRFSSQCAFRHRSLGAHRVVAMPREDRARFVEYCPEAVDVFPCLAEYRGRG